MKIQKDGVSKICRKRRPKLKSGECQDEAVCHIRCNGVITLRKLGKWGEGNVQTEYQKVLREFSAGKFREEILEISDGATLAYLFDQFLEMAVRRYLKADVDVFKLVIGAVIDIYPDMMVKNFMAMNYRTVRNHLVAIGGKKKKPWSRQYVNKIMAALRCIFRWGVSYDYVPVEVVQRMACVPAIKENEYDVLDEREKVGDVPDAVVLRTLPYMPPVIADMIKIQRGASMRPSEVCRLRVGDLDRGGMTWIVRFVKHKTARFGVDRFISFSAAETEILRRRSEGKGADEFIFSPRDAMRERWESRAAARKSKVTPSQKLRTERDAAGKFERYKECYDSRGYYQAVQYAIKRARKAGEKIPDWFPYQLRHAAVTANSLRYGQEAAGKIAGHKSVKTTDIYNHSAEKLSRNAAEEREEWWE